MSKLIKEDFENTLKFINPDLVDYIRKQGAIDEVERITQDLKRLLNPLNEHYCFTNSLILVLEKRLCVLKGELK
jgi:hypothetical protein